MTLPNSNNSNYSLDFFQSDVATFQYYAGKSTAVARADLEHQLSLIQEELKETIEALATGDYVDLLDGYTDMMVTVVGFGLQLQELGMQTNEALQETAENNLSKFVAMDSVVEISETLKKYNGEVSPYLIDKVVVFRDKAGKVRKPASFVSNDLSKFVPEGLKHNG